MTVDVHTRTYRVSFISITSSFVLSVAPEIFLTGRYNLKIDVYSFAIVLHCMLSLVRPFEKYNAQLHTLLVCKEGVRPPIPHEWPPELRDLLRFGWAQRPADRPSMKETRQMLERVAQRVVDEGVPPSPMHGKNEPLLTPLVNDTARLVDKVCAHPCTESTGNWLRKLEQQVIRGTMSSLPTGSNFGKPHAEHAQFSRHLRSLYL